MAYKINSDCCIGCETCLCACPCNAISSFDGVCKIDTSECVECGCCIDECPVGAIENEEAIGTKLCVVNDYNNSANASITSETSLKQTRNSLVQENICIKK